MFHHTAHVESTVERLTRHEQCVILSDLFRGKMCEALAQGAGRHVAAGAYIYTMGQMARSIYLVRLGLVKTSMLTQDGEEVILRVHKQGEYFGELCFCAGGRREQAVALHASEVVEIPFEALMSQLRQDSEQLFELLAAMCERLAEANDRLLSVSFDSTMERLVRTLLRLAAEMGEREAGGTRIGHYIKQDDLARMVPARREVVSSLLNRLREQGLVTYSHRGLISVNREALEAYLKPNRPNES